MSNLHDKIKELYLDYRNNFLTVSAFADHYHISECLARAIINEGVFLHEFIECGDNEDKRLHLVKEGEQQ